MALNTPAKAKTVVVSREQLFGWGRMMWWATLHSLFVLLGVTVAGHTPNPTPAMLAAGKIVVHPWEVIHLGFVFAVLIVAPVPWLYRHVRGWRIFVYGIICGIGLLIWGFVRSLVLIEMQVQVPVLHLPGMHHASFGRSALVLGGFFGCCLTWLVCRLVRGPIVVQDGTLCPNCAYSLIGSVEQVCSECGREFTFQELGTSREHFAAIRSPARSDVSGNAEARTVCMPAGQEVGKQPPCPDLDGHGPPGSDHSLNN